MLYVYILAMNNQKLKVEGIQKRQLLIPQKMYDLQNNKHSSFYSS